MTLTTIATNYSLFDKYLNNHFYVKLNAEGFKSVLYYNTVFFDIFAVIPYENIDELSQTIEICDYITIVADSSNIVEFQDERIGIVYIDIKNSSEDQGIIIARLPYRQKVSSSKRITFLKSTGLKNFYRPFWEYYDAQHNAKSHGPLSNTNTEKNFKNAQITLERGIQNFCKQNNLEREEINSLQTFVDYIIGDIFKYKLTVAEDQQLREEAAHPDTLYPEVLLKLMIKMGLVE